MSILLFLRLLGFVVKNEMITSKKLIEIIDEDEYQMYLDLGRRIIHCPICGNETFDDLVRLPILQLAGGNIAL